MDKSIADIYGNKVRVRACGLCWRGDSLLMVSHMGIKKHPFWAPPGGGVDFGISIQQTLIKEFKEETGLLVEPQNFLFACEYINPPLHAVEIFFKVTEKGGLPEKGNDPELPIINDVRFIDFDEVKAMPSDHLHGIFGLVNSPQALRDLRGFHYL